MYIARRCGASRAFLLRVIQVRARVFLIDYLLVRIHSIIAMIRWTILAPWEFESPFPGSLTSTFLGPHRSCLASLSFTTADWTFLFFITLKPRVE